MNYISDTIYDAIEELIFQDINYIDSSAFSNSTLGTITDNLFKYIDHFLMYRRPETNNYVVLNIGVDPQLYNYIPPDIPRGAV